MSNIFENAMVQTPEDIKSRLANGGGLFDVIPTQNPIGHQGTERGDGFTYYPGPGDGKRYRQPEGLGAPPNIKDPDKDLVLRNISKVRTFDMSNDQDVLDYQRVMTDCGNGQAQFAESHRIECKQTGNLKVWMRWWELVWEPRSKRGIPAAGG